MPYLALYRKFRPRTFSDVKGQDHIVRTLVNELKLDRIGHAYLFTGTRGTGKTTVAKILAKAVNCDHRDENEDPCNECEFCQSVNNGSSMDVMELDAASNNSVEAIRGIISSMEYPPSVGKYRVYIIDEVHMLSTAAWNALLKSLEEPPSYVIFILATTELQKIPQTILSRCQRYEFHRISIDTIKARLLELTEKEGVKAEDKALYAIAKAGDGSMRDAISLLDQCMAFYLGQDLTYDNVLSVLGAVDTSLFSRLFNAVRVGDSNAALSVIDEVLVEGRELTQFSDDFVWYLRNLLLVKGGIAGEDIVGISSDNMKELEKEAADVDDAVLLRYIRVISALSDRLRTAVQKRVVTEVAIIKLCHPEMEKDTGSLSERISRLEEKLSSGAFLVQAQGMPQSDAGPSVAAVAPVQKKALPEALPEDIQTIVENWDQVIRQVTGLLRSSLREGMATLSDDGKLLIVFNEEQQVAYNLLSTEENKKRIEEILSGIAGKEVPVLFKIEDSGKRREDEHEDIIQKFARDRGVEITVEDDFDDDN